jgi:hypothetical protein
MDIRLILPIKLDAISVGVSFLRLCLGMDSIKREGVA